MTKFSRNSRIYIAGHNGMVGSSCMRLLIEKGYKNIIVVSSKELDLRNQNLVKNFFKSEKPEYVINAAAKVGGILANDTYPYDFIMDNILIQNNLIKFSHEFDVKKFIFLGSSCIYPKNCKQPIREEYLLTGPLEKTNQWYAIAKIAGVKLIESLRKQHKKNYISLMPTNLYGPRDNYNLETSHVMPALIRKFSHAKKYDESEVVLWGSGTPLREFLYVDDLSKAILFCLENNLNHSIYNIGSGEEISIQSLGELISKKVGFNGKITFDKSKPDGTKKKLLDSSRFNKISNLEITPLDVGLNKTIKDYINA